jgi:hypothetical protein
VYLLLIDPIADFLGARGEGRSPSLMGLLSEVRGYRDFGPMWFVIAPRRLRCRRRS